VVSFGTGRSLLSIVGAAWIAASCAFPDYKVDEGDPLARICTDNLPSAAETGIDCGGGCPPCGVDQPCRAPQDCASGACVDGTCHLPTCDDDVKNATEADVDCGGPCPACRPGKDCQQDHDCAEGVCAQQFCQPPTCADTVKNGDETGADCGGSCGPCDNGEGCTKDDECKSKHCSDQVCVLPACADGLLNGAETDLDCGGECSPCPAGDHCTDGVDCQSHICEDLQCTAYACNDGVKNGEETDLDCGGRNCPGCGVLEHCEGASDCQSGVCVSGYCVPATATNVVLSRDGWQAKASNTYPDDVPNEFLDSVGGRWTSGAYQYPGMWIEVDMRQLRTFFSIVLDCTEAPADAPAQFDVFLSRDGKYGAPAQSGLYGAATSTIKFDTAQLARYIKIVLKQDKMKWWSINELNVYQ
jgi:hypothetical protein